MKDLFDERRLPKMKEQLHLPPPELQGEDDIFDLLDEGGFQSIGSSSGMLLHSGRILSSSANFSSNRSALTLSSPIGQSQTAGKSFFSSSMRLDRLSNEQHRDRGRFTTGKATPEKTAKKKALPISPKHKATNCKVECGSFYVAGPARSSIPATAYYAQDQVWKQLFPASMFMDNQELERNVRMDLETKRGYVYTTDLAEHGLPEFLFLDVPNDDFAVSLCGRWITNHLVVALKEEIHSSRARKRDVILGCNLETFEKDVYHPLTPDGSVGEVLTLKFRLRAIKSKSHINSMLAQNFLGRPCPRGIVVLLPSIKPKSPFHSFWGNSPKVPLIPEHDENLTNNRMDNFCKSFALHYGNFYGDFDKPGSSKSGHSGTSVARQCKEIKSSKKQEKSPSRLKRKTNNPKVMSKRVTRGKHLLLAKGCNSNAATKKVNTRDC
jgi:hypothetical protein